MFLAVRFLWLTVYCLSYCLDSVPYLFRQWGLVCLSVCQDRFVQRSRQSVRLSGQAAIM